MRSSTRAAGRGRPLITRKWLSGYQIIEQRAYAYAALTEDCERAVDEAGGAEVKLRDAPVSHSVICLGLHGHARSRRYGRSPGRRHGHPCRARMINLLCRRAPGAGRRSRMWSGLGHAVWWIADVLRSGRWAFRSSAVPAARHDFTGGQVGLR